ncbi:4Fe-4S dicluster domain-containing protein [Streptomyces sp. NPDC059037]|uniref:4Fe-4S dicluster domain-containing protein n=1 Tax=Streptomyces sp. NPDC059037 TaxID=3346710 RepID=UPI00369932E2
MTTGAATAVLDRNGLNALVAELNADGRRVVGPTVRDGAIVLAELESADQLPYGWGVELEAGHYRLRRRGDGAAFAHSAGPQSWKNFLHPQREKLWSADRAPDGTVAISTETADRPSYAFLGVRPCDLRAIAIQDRVLTGGHFKDTGYEERRRGAFLIAAECTEPGATCFCVSMGGGPGADAGFDLALTEVVDRMRRAMPPVSLRQLMGSSLEAERWDDIASRCLTCGNCMMVCPTCFCTTTEEVTDLTGDHAERRQRWDSCFDLDFSYVHGGPVRSSGRSRYRQWLTHKLGTWHDQFDSSGCVGCGRCIVWCPVGIDITEEVAALKDEADKKETGR